MPKLYIHALGCKTNHYENQALAGQLLKQGFILEDKIENADVGILNTCTVTAEAGRKSRQFLHRMKKLNPNMIVVAMGCLAQLQDISEDCDLVIGTSNRSSVLDLLQQRLAENKEEMSDLKTSDFRQDRKSGPSEPPLHLGCASRETEYEELGIVARQEDTRAEIKIQDGCNSFCSYCAIPLARGRVRSRLRENILKEASLLVRNGHREIVLTGIHICSFEKEKGRGSEALAELCLELNEIEGLRRIRLGSLEPLSVDHNFLSILRKADKVCPHFHLSLQSGSDSVLQRMKRQYTSEQYRERVDLIRELYENPAITTDIMVGFPEETEQEFEDSFSFAEKIKFSRLHVFPYSVRPGTLAAGMGQVDGQIIKERTARMLQLADLLAEDYAAKQVGKTLSVLFEDEAGGYSRGYTPRYLRVHVRSGQNPSGEIKQVLINRAEKGELFGEII